jgi:ribosomal protein L40E
MQHCTRCGAASPDDALSCQRCGHPFDRGKQQKKQRSFLAGLLLLLGIRRNPQTGSLGCAKVPTISVALVAVIITGVLVGPVLKLIPPFAPSLTVIGAVVPGGSVVVHGTNFPAGSRINLTLDGTSIGLALTSHHSIQQSLYDVSISAVQVNSLRPTAQFLSSAGSITVRSDGAFDAQVSIPTSWQPNSQHVIQAQTLAQDGTATAQARVAVSMQQAGTVQGNIPTATPTDTPVPQPTPTDTPVQRILTSQQTQSQTVNATGQGTTPGTQATGTLSLRNPYHGTPKGVDMTLNAGTVFDDDTNRTPNVQMMIDATITVPGDGTSVTVPAHVVQIGTIGNISQIRGWTHYGAYGDPVPLDIYNSTPFTGGTDPQSYTTVQQSDIDTAANSLTASTRQSAVADLNSQLQSNEHLVGDPQCTYNTTSDHAADDQATTVTVTVMATCTATAST